MGRAPCCDKANVKRGPWSPDEDALLKSFIDSHGTCGNWINLPKKAGLKRCGKSCRLRWLNYLRPDIKHGGFTEEEDNIIFNLYNQVGSRWSVIASQLPGRTDNDIKNYWNTKLKKKILPGKINPSSSSSTNAMNYNNNTSKSTGHDALGSELAHADLSSFPESLDNIHYGSLNANSFSIKSEIGSICSEFSSSMSQEYSSITSSNSPSLVPPMDNGLVSLMSGDGGFGGNSGAQTSDVWFGFGWDKIIDELLSDDASIDQSFIDLNLLH